MTVFDKNIAAIKLKRPDIAHALLQSPQGTAYKGIVIAKTGEPVPLFASGQALHSLYNPQKEAERTLASPASFTIFCGLGNGIHLKVFLAQISAPLRKPITLHSSNYFRLSTIPSCCPTTAYFYCRLAPTILLSPRLQKPIYRRRTAH